MWDGAGTLLLAFLATRGFCSLSIGYIKAGSRSYGSEITFHLASSINLLLQKSLNIRNRDQTRQIATDSEYQTECLSLGIHQYVAHLPPPSKLTILIKTLPSLHTIYSLNPSRRYLEPYRTLLRLSH